MTQLIGFLLLVLALAMAAILADVALRYFVLTYLLPTPENERFSDRWRESYAARTFNHDYDARRDAILEAERRRRADGGAP